MPYCTPFPPSLLQNEFTQDILKVYPNYEIVFKRTLLLSLYLSFDGVWKKNAIAIIADHYWLTISLFYYTLPFKAAQITNDLILINLLWYYYTLLMLLAIHLFLKEKEFADQSSYMEHEIYEHNCCNSCLNWLIFWFVHSFSSCSK